MTCPQKESVWPFLCILACLFVLSVAAPRAWDRASRQRTATEAALAAATAELEAEREAVQAAQAQASAVIVPAVPTPSAVAPQPVMVEPAAKITGGALSVHRVSDPGVDDELDDELDEHDDGWDDAQPALETLTGPSEAPAAVASPTPSKPALELAVRSPSTRSAASDPAPVPPRGAPAETTESAPDVSLRQVQRLPSTSQPAVTASPVATPRWGCPESLRQRLEKLSAERSTAAWVQQTRQLLDALQPASAGGVAALQQALAALERHVSAAEPLAERLSAPAVATQLRRAGHAVARRVTIWKQAVAAGGPALVPGVVSRVDPQQLSLCLANLDLLRDGSEEARAWQKFLFLEQFSTAVAQRAAGEQELHRLARAALARLALPMTPEQREVIASEPVTALAAELRRWAIEPVDLAQVLDALEHFERSGLPSHARRVAEDYRRLSYSPRGAEREMAERLETLYRNANLRIALSQTLLNRLVPAREPEYDTVRDTILGVPVQGRSVSSSDLAVRFVPDPQRLLMSFEVQGSITAATSSDAGPAVFYSDSHAQYLARKPLEIEAAGVRLGETDVSVENNTRLRGLRTKFDFFPILGSLVREVARNQHEQQRGAANQEAEWKVMQRARERIDAESYTQLEEAVGKMRERLFAPLADLSLMPTLVGGQTTTERMTMRLRLAAERQLGSDTPRPRAPSDSQASMQVHETAINNLLEQLGLNGRRMALPELLAHLSSKLHRPTAWNADPAYEDVSVTFAAQDAVYVRCTDNLLTLTLSIVQLSAGDRAWSNFQVRVHYRPEAHGRAADMVRDGVVQLAGRLSTGSQIAVRGVFSKIFAKDSRFTLTPEWLLTDDRLQDLAVTQFVVDDGWIGLALGPQRGGKRGPAGATEPGDVVKGTRGERKDRLGWRKSTGTVAR